MKSEIINIIKIVSLCAIGIVTGVDVSQAASIVTTNSDSGSPTYLTSTFTAKGFWNDSAAPSGANDYYITSGYSIRTPADTTNYIFQGNSLTLQGPGTTTAGGGRIIAKNSGATVIYTITNLVITNLGMLHAAGGSGAMTIAGNLNTYNGGGVLLPANGPIAIASAISGTGPLWIGSPSQASSGSITLEGSISNYTGNIYQTNSSSALIFSNAASQTFSGIIAVTNPSTLTIQGPGVLTLANANTYRGTTTLGVSASLAAVRAAASGALSTNTIVFDTTGNGSTARLELTNGITLNNAITFSGRTAAAVGIENDGGNNTLGGTISASSGGSIYLIQSDNGLLTLSGTPAIAAVSGSRIVTLQGAGNGLVSGAITNGAGTISLVKSGTGTWTLSGTDTYTGTTTVSNGTLSVSSNIGSNTVTVAGGTLAFSGSGTVSNGTTVVLNSTGKIDVSAASGSVLGTGSTLTGTGAINGNFTDSAGATLLPGGAGAVGTLTFSNNLTLAAGDLNKFDFATGSNDLYVVYGSLNNSAGSIINLATLPAGGLANGTYTLMQVFGTLGGSAANFTLTGKPSPSRQTFNIVYTSGSPNLVQLQVGGSAGSLVWFGTSTAWDITTTADWTNAASLSTDYYFDGDNVSFTDLGAATSPVLNTSIQPGSVTFNSASAYTLSGTGSINGSAGLTKTGNGTLTIQNTNNYTGVTILGGGTISIGTITNGGGASPLGAAASAPANLVFDGGTLQYSSSDTPSTDRGATLGTGGGTLQVSSSTATLTMSGVIAGSSGGALTKSGNGTLVLSGANTYNGPTTIGTGILQIGSGSATGAPGTGNITDNSALVFARTGTLTLSNNISGAGSLTNNGGGTIVLAGTNTYYGSTVINTGIVQAVSALALGSTPAAFDPAHLNIAGGELEASISFSISDTNTGVTVSNGVIAVDSGITLAISNEIASVNALTKSLPGTLVLSGSNSLVTLNVDSASQTASDGVVLINSTNALGAAQTIQVRNNQAAGSSTLQLDGTAGAITVNPATWTWSGRNNMVPAIENVAGDNIWNPSTITLNSGGTFYGFQCDAGSLTIPTYFPSTAPAGQRIILFEGSGLIWISGGIQPGGCTNLTVVKTNTGSLVFAGSSSYTGLTTLHGGSLNVADGGSFGVSTTNIEIAPLAGETATLNVSNASVTAQRVIIAGITANTSTPGVGAVNQTGGTIDSYQWFTAGSGGTTGGSGTYNLSSGTLNVHSDQLEVANFAASTGTVNQASGAINLWNSSYIALGANASAGPGTFNQSGGTVTFYSDSGSTVGGSGILYLGKASGLTNNYIYNLAGGTLQVPAITSVSGNSLFYFNGGTLAAAKTNTSFMSGLTAAYVSTNGAAIDSGSYAVTIAQPLIHDPALGTAADGGLTNQSSASTGVLTLAGTNTYTGPTVINSGILNIAGSLGATAVAINGGTLGGTGVISGPVTLNYGTNAPGGSGVIGTLTISNSLTLQGGTVQYDMTRSSNDVLAVSGAVNVTGATTLLLAFPYPNVGVYTLISYGSLSGFENLTLALTTPNPRFSFTLSNDPSTQTIKVTVTGNSANLVWQGDGSVNGWDNAGNYQNWLKSGSADYFYDGDVVTFNDTGSDSPSINLTTTVSPASVTVNAAQNYDFAGSGLIAGTGSLTKSGTGTLTLEDNNTYSGVTLINGGAIQVGNGGSSGSLGTGAITNNDSLILDRSDAIVMPSPISGSGTVTMAGSFVTASSSNYYTGASTINSGVTYLKNSAGLGATNGTITVASGAQLYLTANVDFGANPLTLAGTGDGNGALRKGGAGTSTYAGATTLTGDTTIVADGSATLNLSSSSGINGSAANANLTLAGSGAGVFSGPLTLGSGGLTVSAGTWTVAPTNNFTGLTTVNAGTLRITGGSLGNPASFTANQITLAGGTLEAITNAAFNDGLAGITLNANTTLVVDTNMTLVISNEITGGYNLTKSSGGTLILNGSNTFSGTLYVDNNGGGAAIYDGITDIASSNALVNVSTIYQRNNNSGSSTLELDGTLGSIVLPQSLYISCRNVATANIENAAGSNTISGPIYVAQGGGSLYFQSDAGTLNLAGDIQYTGPLNGGRTYIFTGAGNHVVSGVITAPINTNAPINVAMNGTGTLTLANANTYTNTTTVNSGTLLVNGSINSVGGVTVNGGTLGGIGAINDAVTVASGGTLSPGAGGIGTLTISSNLTLAGTTYIEVNRSTGARDQIVAINTVNYGGTLFATNQAGALSIGDSFTVISATNYTGTFASITGTPGTGLAWSFNAASGVLSVVKGIPTTPTNLTYSVSGTQLTLAWPTNYVGWILQSQTNSLAAGLGTNWVDVAGSGNITHTNVTIDPAEPATFYRLRLP